MCPGLHLHDKQLNVNIKLRYSENEINAIRMYATAVPVEGLAGPGAK